MNTLPRWSFLCFALVSTITATAFSAVNSTDIASGPNILWISCEDISSHLGCYGEPRSITPAIDEFAKEAVRYTRAFTVHGVCAPSRSGIITGIYPSRLGSVNMRCRATLPDSVQCFTEYLRDAGYYCTNNSKEDYNFKTPKSAWDVSGSKAHWNQRPEGAPFFAVFNFFRTHESQLWNSADFDNTHPKSLKESEWQKPENMTIPPIYPDGPEVRRDFARLFERITEFDHFVKKQIDELKDAGLYDNTIIFIWSDHGNGLPRAKRWLYDSGTRVPLIVRIPPRFRTEQQGQPGVTDDQLINLIDLGPTVLNLAGIKMPNHMDGQPFLGSNLPAPRKYIFGARQRIDEFHDMVRSVRDERYRYVQNFMPFVPYLHYLKYAENCNTLKAMRKLHSEGKLNPVQLQWLADSRPAEELYDLQKDPWETHNLAGDRQYAAIRNRLRNTLEDWMVQTQDTGLIPEPEMIRLAQQYGSEYSIFEHTGGKERVEKLTKLAFIASDPTPSDRETILKALKDKDPAVRYWAVLAMRALALENPKDIDIIVPLSKDENPSVRIASAWTLYLLGEKTQAVSILENELKQFDQQVQVLQYAMHVLNQLGPESRSALETVKILNNKRGEDSRYLKDTAEHFISKLEEN